MTVDVAAVIGDSRVSDPHDELVAELYDAGWVTDEWLPAFRALPRDRFVTRFAVAGTDGRWSHCDLLDPQLVDRSRVAVASDTDLVVRWDSAGIPVASCPPPSVVAIMLAHLDVHSHCRVLQVGTGTGYTTALLCRRLGDERVITVELDPALAQAATAELAAAGHRPRVIVGDGTRGLRTVAPVDRLLATMDVSRIPPAWLWMARPTGLIVTSLGGRGVRLVVAPDGSASGRFLPLTPSLSPVREQVTDTGLTDEDLLGMATAAAVTRRDITLPPELDEPTVAWLLALSLPGLRHTTAHRRDHRVWVDTTTGDWADLSLTAADDTWTLRETATAPSGQRLWDRITTVIDTWRACGRPDPTRYGLTVDPTGRHRLWTDDEHRQDILLDSVYRLPDDDSDDDEADQLNPARSPQPGQDGAGDTRPE